MGRMGAKHNSFTRTRFVACSFCLTVIGQQLMVPHSVEAEWSVQGESYVFYTDDAALFSSSRRLARDQDPTQPVVDRALGEQGEDIVYEPVAQITKSFGSPGSETEITVRSQGFVFADNDRFNHGTVGVQVKQELSSATKVGFRYFVGPDLLLGKNAHLWSARNIPRRPHGFNYKTRGFGVLFPISAAAGTVAVAAAVSGTTTVASENFFATVEADAKGTAN